MARRVHHLFAVAVAALSVAVLSPACTKTGTRPAPPPDGLVECPSGSIDTPEQARKFASCSAVIGDLLVRGTNLFDLRALSNVGRVEGALLISDNPNLENLNGLERLRAVGRLEIRNNPKLESVSSLSSLADAQSVSLAQNPTLRSLVGLGRLERLERLELEENGLYDLRGLDGLEEVGELVVERNRSLISLGGLANVRRAGAVQIHENPRLCGRLGLFPRLDRVERELTLTKNWGLTEGEVQEVMARVRRDAAAPPSDNELALSEP